MKFEVVRLSRSANFRSCSHIGSGNLIPTTIVFISTASLHYLDLLSSVVFQLTLVAPSASVRIVANKSQLRKTLDQTDAALAKAIADLAKAQTRVSQLQRRIPELQAAANSIRVLLGEKPKVSEVQTISEADVVKMLPRADQPLSAYSPTAPIPAGVGSIPSRQPKPTTANAATDVIDEEGFS